MAHTIEKTWTTAADYLAVVIMVEREPYSRNHRCGYVAIPESHPAFQKEYNERLPEIKQEDVDKATIGKKSPILAFTATCSSDDEFNTIRRSIDILIDVHGGVTYSGENDGYPIKVEDKQVWWFGFDCAHYGDDNEGGQSLAYVTAECESMATQLLTLANKY